MKIFLGYPYCEYNQSNKFLVIMSDWYSEETQNPFLRVGNYSEDLSDVNVMDTILITV